LISEEAIERNFGLLVALNLGAPDAIKAIDKTNISNVALQSREQAGRDPAITGELDEALVAGILSKSFTKIWLAIPEVLQWEDIEGFAFRINRSGFDDRKAGPVVYQDLDIEEWLRVTKLGDDLTLDHLKKRKIFIVYKDGREPTPWRIYRCLNAEIDLRRKKYILNDGDWYDVDRDFVSEINAFYDGVPTSAVALPPFGGKTEPKYLEYFKPEKLDFAYMDRKEVMVGGGHSRVEFCDLFSKANDIVHVKRYGGSSVLSHLFNQAVVSADCFLNEPAFRAGVNRFLPSAYKLPNTSISPVPSKYTVCFAIMSKESGPLELPFFSKVSLRYAVKNLRRLGFKVTKLKIDR
jgi:uncharacterized protein (TIGR04141 family)